MKMASETTPLTSGDESRTYLFLSQRHRNRRSRIRQFQCCVCAAILGIFVTAMVITVSYSMNHDPADDIDSNSTDNNEFQVLKPAPLTNAAALKTLLLLQWPRPDVSPQKWAGPAPTYSEVAAALEAGETSLRNKDILEARAVIEQDDSKSPGILKLGTPSYMHQQAVKTSSEAIKAARVGYVIGKATETLLKTKVPNGSVGKGPQVKAYWIPTGMVCKDDDEPSKPSGNSTYAECPPTPYRSMDGTCNNLIHSDWGVAMRPLRRVLPPDYGDGISSPRKSKSGSKLPSARDVSLTIHRPIYRNDPKFTVMLAVWGQFLDHDISATALSKSKDGAPIACCTANGSVAVDNVNPECYPVILSPEDPYYSDYGMTCMEFVRSAPAPTCHFGPRQQLNQITSYMDGSVVYGSSEEQAVHLRSPTGKGELQMLLTADGRELLPPSTDPRDGCNTPEMNKNGKYCFMSGDSRANENLHLTTMHLLMAREHNRIVRVLSQMNPTWTDEHLYQEGRRIVSAMLQHVTYNEFLPVVVGDSVMERLKLAPNKDGYFQGYDPEVDPSVANNFATAAFRFAHTLLPTLMRMLSNDTSSEEYVELHKMLFNPFALYYPGKLDGALEGAMNTDVQRVDTYITPEVTQHLFQQRWGEDYDKAMEKSGTKPKGKKKGYGLDLASLNVQRGRDHGLPPYVKWREFCGLSKPSSFSDLEGEMDEASLQRLATLYQSVDDVDMYSGSLSETPLGEGLLGPTFTCLIADQFLRLKTGDRYWYETSEQPQAFTPEQLNEIRKTSLASIICENSGVERSQQYVMRTVDETNPRMPCTSIPRLQLEAWQDKSMVGHVSLSSAPIHVRAMPKDSSSSIPPAKSPPFAFIKGTVSSASITAMGSDGSFATLVRPSSTFPMTIPAHLFDQKIPVSDDTKSNYAGGLIPPFYHGGGGVTWTGMQIATDPSKAHFRGSFSVPVFKHGATAFEFSTVTYTGDFDITLNLVGNGSLAGLPTLQGTYNSGIYFKQELPFSADSDPSLKDMESVGVDSGKDSTLLPKAPITLYGSYSFDHTLFYWDGNVSFVLPSTTVPPTLASSSDIVSKPKATSMVVDVSAVWGVVTASANPAPKDGSANSKTVVTTWWDGTFPVAIPQPAFDRMAVTDSITSLPPKPAGPGDGVTWSGSLTPVVGSLTNDVQFNGTFTFPVFLHGPSPSGFTLQIWHGDFGIVLRPSLTSGATSLPVLLGPFGSGQKFKSPIFFRAAKEMATPDDVSGDSNVTIPIILHGYTSIDKSIFYWNGNASVIIPQSLESKEMKMKSSMSSAMNLNQEKSTSSHNLAAAGAALLVPVELTILSGSVNMTGSSSPNAAGKNFTWDGEFPITFPKSPFYRSGPLVTEELESKTEDIDYPYSPLADATKPVKPTFNSGLTWSNLSAEMINSSTTDFQINGTLSFPVFYFGSSSVGPWTGPAIENWSGNFSCIVRANSTTNITIGVDYILSMISAGNLTSSVFFKDVSKDVKVKVKKLVAASEGETASSAAKIKMLAHGIPSVDGTEFYWNGVITVYIPFTPTDVLESATHLGKLNSVQNPLGSKSGKGSKKGKKTRLPMKLLSGSVTSTSSDAGTTTLWDGTLPFTVARSYFSKYSADTPFVGGPVKWAAQISRDPADATQATIAGTFEVPIFDRTSGSMVVEHMTGNFSFTVSSDGIQTIADILPSSVKLSTPIIMGYARPTLATSLKESLYKANRSELLETGMSNLMASMDSDDSEVLPIMPVIFFGIFEGDLFTFNGDILGIVPMITPDPVPVRPYEYLEESLEYVKLQAGNVRPYITGTVVSGDVKGLSETGLSYWWGGSLPLPISVPPFDSLSPNAGIFNWPYDPAFFNGTGGVTWTGVMSGTTSVKNGLTVRGTFSVPTFSHGNPSAFEVDEWKGDFSLTVSVLYNNTVIDSSLPEGTFNSPLIFREHKMSGNKDPSAADIDVISEVQSLMALSSGISASDSVRTSSPRVPLILWGNYSVDKSIFYWEGNVTVVFPPILNTPLLNQKLTAEETDVNDSSSTGKKLRLPMKIVSGSINSSSPNFGSNILWNGSVPFTVPRSYFSKYSFNTSFIGGPVQWSGHVIRDAANVNGALIEGSFSIPILVHSNGTIALEFMSGDFSLSVSFEGMQNLVNLIPNTGKYSTYMILASAPPNPEASMEVAKLESNTNSLLKMGMNNLKDSATSEISESDPDAVIVIPIILFGDFALDTFTFNGDAIAIVPDTIPPLNPLKPGLTVMSTSASAKKKPGLVHPYISGTLTSGSVIGLSKKGTSYWWSGSLPLAIAMPPFDSVSPDAGIYTWPYEPESYNGTGGLTWTGALTGMTSVKNGITVHGTFTVPVFIHGNPSVFDVDEWKGDFSLTMSVYYNNTPTDSLMKEGTFKSPVIFHESNSSGLKDPSGTNIDTIATVQNLLMSSSASMAKEKTSAVLPRAPIILWGSFSPDRKIFYWEGNTTVIFPSTPMTPLALKQQSSSPSSLKAEDTRLRLPMKILSGSITSSSSNFGEKVLWDGSVPFTFLRSYFSKYSVNTSFIGGPVQWSGHIARDAANGNGAHIEGSFSIPILVHVNKTVALEVMTGDFSFDVSFNGTLNLVDFIPTSGKYGTFLILANARPNLVASAQESIEKAINVGKNNLMAPAPGEGLDTIAAAETIMPVVIFGDFGPENFTFNGDAVAIIPVTTPTLQSMEGSGDHAKNNFPAIKPTPRPRPPEIKVFGKVTSGTISGGALGRHSHSMWHGELPVFIPVQLFDKHTNRNESRYHHPPHRLRGGVSWGVHGFSKRGDRYHMTGEFYFPIFNHGKNKTLSVTIWMGKFSLDFTVSGNHYLRDKIMVGRSYSSRMYFHNSKSDDDSFDLEGNGKENVNVLNSHDRSRHRDEDDWDSRDRYRPRDEDDWDSRDRHRPRDEDDWDSRDGRRSRDEDDWNPRYRYSARDEYNRERKRPSDERRRSTSPILVLLGTRENDMFAWEGKFLLVYRED